MTLDKEISQTAMLKQLSVAFMTIPFNQMLGLKLEDLSEKEVVLSFTNEEKLIGNYMMGILHGGVISSVLDMAGGMLAMSQPIYKNPEASMEVIKEMIAKCSTIDLNIHYLRPGKGRHFSAKSILDKSGKHLCFTRMELLNDENTLIATASATYLLVT